jgi:hypothetical protein
VEIQHRRIFLLSSGMSQNPMMLMCGTPHAEVVKTLEEVGARLIEAVEDPRADPVWMYRYYVVVKR